MNFSSIATEIRLKILSELLVLPQPIDFVANYGPLWPLSRGQRDGLCPAVLRVSRMMHREASLLLYSNNRFRFPEVFSSTLYGHTSAHISPFLDQIGSYARLIRYICIPFPTFDHLQLDGSILHEADIRNLELMRDTCTGIQTLELLVEPKHCIYALYSTIGAEALDLLDTCLKSIPSLKEIIVNFKVYPERDPDDDLTKKMCDHGWTVQVTKLPKKVWTSYDDRVEFDNEDDLNAYNNNERFRREEEEGKKSRLEECYQRRHDPYWKNRSDYY